MSDAPTRASAGGRTYLALRKKARDEGRPTEELLVLGALEAFVDRLSASSHAPTFALKGGILLAVYDARRPTRDVDLSARNVPNEPSVVAAIIEEILKVDREDGWRFGATRAEVIREQDVYSGVRVNVPCQLATANLMFHVDVNVGDVVSPPAVDVALPRLLGGEIRMRGYPLTMVVAEKIVTMVQRGVGNTRWRDFADVVLLARAHHFVGAELMQSVQAVASHRGARLAELSTVLAGYANLVGNRWAAWIRKQRLADRLSLDFGEVLERAQRFADPVLRGAADDGAWDPGRATWMRR